MINERNCSFHHAVLDEVSGQLWYLDATDPIHNSEPALLQAWRDAGARDVADFLQAHHWELKVGGQFIGAISCLKNNGDYPWSKV